jgi:glycosyltransferase involved in cell wall biosynthesis
MRLAILGTRGIPASYGGFETFAEELSTRLVARGHDVTVYCRPQYVPAELRTHRGVHLMTLPTIRHKYLDTVVHTALSVLHTTGCSYDVALVCNAANAFATLWPRVIGMRVALNVDGIERRRRKWSAFGRGWYRASEWLATILPNSVITDAEVIQRYYAERYGAASTFIPYGCTPGRTAGQDALRQFGLTADGYFLYVSRLEPENNALAVIRAFEATRLDQRLVVVGDAPYAREYIRQLREAAGPRVLFTGGVYGKGYRELQCHALAYIHATEVGGTHPALVEAMGFGNCVLSHEAPENREVTAGTALFFDAHETTTLTALLERVAADPVLVAGRRSAAAARATATYSWERVTDQYERVLADLCRRSRTATA